MKICSMPDCGLLHTAKGLCKKHYYAEYRKAHPEQSRAASAKCYAMHRDERLAASASYREINRDLVNKKARSAMAKKRKEGTAMRDYDAAYRTANPEKTREWNRAWRKANPDLVRALDSTKRARRRGSVGSHTAGELKKLFTMQKGRCAICCVDLSRGHHKDHIVPLMSGGANDIRNIQFLCPSCNCSKGAKDPIKFMQSRGYLL